MALHSGGNRLVTPGRILVKLAAAQTTADYSATPAIPFDTIVYNTGGFTLNAGGVVIPAGVSLISARTRVAVSSHLATTNINVAIYIDGAGLSPSAEANANTAATAPILNVISPIYPVTETQVITSRITTTDTSITVAATSWLEVVIEGYS